MTIAIHNPHIDIFQCGNIKSDENVTITPMNGECDPIVADRRVIMDAFFNQAMSWRAMWAYVQDMLGGRPLKPKSDIVEDLCWEFFQSSTPIDCAMIVIDDLDIELFVNEEWIGDFVDQMI